MRKGDNGRLFGDNGCLFGDNGRLFGVFFATGCTRYEYVHLIDEAEEYYETPSDTTSRDTVKIDFAFKPSGHDTTYVDSSR